MTTDNSFDIWEDWAFEDEERLLLSFSRVMLSIIFVMLLVGSTVYMVVATINAAEPWMLFPLGAGIVISWVRWTLTGGTKA